MLVKNGQIIDVCPVNELQRTRRQPILMPHDKPNLKGHLVMHLIMVIFVGFPAWVTWMLPASWVTFTRDGDQVSMKARVCLLYLIPYQDHRAGRGGNGRVENQAGEKNGYRPWIVGR